MAQELSCHAHYDWWVSISIPTRYLPRPIAGAFLHAASPKTRQRAASPRSAAARTSLDRQGVSGVTRHILGLRRNNKSPPRIKTARRDQAAVSAASKLLLHIKRTPFAIDLA